MPSTTRSTGRLGSWAARASPATTAPSSTASPVPSGTPPWILGVEGDTVRAELEALQSDGSLRPFEGTYTVRSGVITSADVREVAGPGDGTTPSDEPGVVPSPSYENCDAARDAGVTPPHPGEPGYGDHLDRDGGRVAREPDPR
ncbi:excalibur calcium-binding domain-containing protein [Streptomyces sp. NPDC057107]|uniref:excalibur calcium-binding domain-containing protein n=1 Tax=Streptomyces sp. NPDC057107 TaxID=3346021 RepID=UPI0036456280